MLPDAGRDSLRVLVLTGARDAELTCELLGAAGIEAVPCASASALEREIGEAPPGAVVVADEMLPGEALGALERALGRQAPWSDLPVVLFVGKRLSQSSLESLSAAWNVTLLERPVRRSTLLTAVRAALRARRRQYELRELLAELETVNGRLAESDRRKDEFLAMLGHELRNPLSAIRNALHLIGFTRLEAAASEPFALIERQTRNLTRLVDDLLDVSRVTMGKISLSPQRVDLREIATRCLEVTNEEAQRHGHELFLTAPSRPVPVEGDVVRLEQVLSNLVTNAIKYTPEGGRIEVVVAAEGAEAVVRVKDDGIGISPEMLPRLFELFTQADRSLERAKGGLGLGLALVKSLVERHGGRIEARSEGEGRGSEFTVRLPLAAGLERPRRPTDALPGAGKRGPLRVALVEDNEDIRVTMRMLIEALGHSVDEAADGVEGLRLILATKPDLALVDIGLPRLDGYELARQARASSATTLVALTGYGQPDDKRRALEAGFDAHLVKPVDMDMLARLLSNPPRRSQPSPEREEGGAALAPRGS